MFYDDVFQTITESSAFSETALLTIDGVEFCLKGIFCSGNYGQRDLDKGYTTRKTVKRQSFQMAKASVPCTLDPAEMVRHTLNVRNTDFMVREVTGNDSGMIVLDLVPGASS